MIEDSSEASAMHHLPNDCPLTKSFQKNCHPLHDSCACFVLQVTTGFWTRLSLFSNTTCLAIAWKQPMRTNRIPWEYATIRASMLRLCSSGFLAVPVENSAKVSRFLLFSVKAVHDRSTRQTTASQATNESTNLPDG